MSTMFSAELLTKVAELLELHEAGLTASDIAAAIGITPRTAQQVGRVVGRVDDQGGPALYLHAYDWQKRIAAHRGETEPVQLPVEGLCTPCTCSPDPSQFDMVNGRPRMIACPRLVTARTMQLVHRAAEHQLRRQVTEHAGAERLVLRTLRWSEAPQSVAALAEATRLPLAIAAEVIDAAVARGAVVALRVQVPGREPEARYRMATATVGSTVV